MSNNMIIDASNKNIDLALDLLPQYRNVIDEIGDGIDTEFDYKNLTPIEILSTGIMIGILVSYLSNVDKNNPSLTVVFDEDEDEDE